jgi:6-phosphogluconolactonase (cycloisomerase 2 family)
VANQGNNVQGTNADSGITGYNVYTSPSFNLTLTTPSTFGSGSGPQCIVEDPSDQFIYTANYNDSTITSRVFDPKSGSLNTSTRVANSYSLNGPATWCLVDGRTN